MTLKRIGVIVPLSLLDRLEKCLRASGAPGMTVDEVRGFGEHANFFSRDLMRSNVRVEVFIDEDKVGRVIEYVKRFAREEHSPAGILTVENVERLINLNDGQEVVSGEP